MQIALAATLLVAVLWFVALRPKGEESTAPAPAPAPQAAEQGSASDGGTSLLSRPEQAKKAVDSANQANQSNADKANGTSEQQAPAASQPQSSAKSNSSSKSSASKEKAATDVKKAAVAEDPSLPIIAAAKKGTVQVVLFWDPSGSDDRFVKSQLQYVNRKGGKVGVRAVYIQDVGRYKALTDVVKVNSSPTVVILSQKLVGRAIVGYTEQGEINGLADAVFRTSN